MQHKTLSVFAGLAICTVLASCGENTATAPSAEGESGTLTIEANGEEFIRQGFTTKDDWQISFDHVYVTLTDIQAYQSDPPFDPQQSDLPTATATVDIADTITVDLAAGDAPVKVAELEAPAGRYNALSWQVVEGDSDYPIVMIGSASKADTTVNFSIKLSEELEFVCGDFIGDERKGILTGGEDASLEATFHFDHLFGDSETDPEDDLNVGALGFDPLAALAEAGELDVDSADLQQQLSEQNYQKLLEILPSLGHVGEGHCRETKLS